MVLFQVQFLDEAANQWYNVDWNGLDAAQYIWISEAREFADKYSKDYGCKTRVKSIMEW